MSAHLRENPVNLLALDGGGVRGISSLLILHEIMEKIKERHDLEETPKPCDYFQLAAGTSTGGLIAIMLGRLRMSTAEAIKEYDNFAGKIFSFQNRKKTSLLSQRFRAETLIAVIQDLVKRRGMGDTMLDDGKRPENASSKVFVCAKASHDQEIPRRFRSYAVDGEDDPFRDCKIWQVSRATTAAPSFFKPMEITVGSRTETFIDGALGCNNPTGQLLQEAGAVFDAGRGVGCIVNVGTGTKTISTGKSRGPKAWVGMIGALKKHATSGSSVDDEIRNNLANFPGTYFHLSVPRLAEDIGLADWKEMDRMKALTREYIRGPAKEEIERIADILGKKESQGLTIGHISPLDKTQLILDNKSARARGTSSRFFRGRTDILQDLGIIFDPNRPSAGHRTEALLLGMGGIGKTQIALKFAETHEDKFQHIFWFDASDSVTIEQGYADLVYKVFDQLCSPKEARAKATNWLEQTKDRWLLIFDNCDDKNMTPFLPSTTKGNVLYTSRNHDLKQRVSENCVIEVEKMPEEDAVDVLLAVARLEDCAPGEQETAKIVVDELGHLPLAIDQAGAYVYMSNSTLMEYLEKLRTAKDDMLRNPRYLGSDEERNVPVYATFDISHNALREYARRKTALPKVKDSRFALKVLSAICFYHNEAATELIFWGAVRNQTVLPPQARLPVEDNCLRELVTQDDIGHWVKEPLDRGLELLKSFSLVKLTNGGVTTSMHPLVHSWARERMSADDRRRFGLSARSILFESFTTANDPTECGYRTAIFNQLQACQGNVQARYDNNPELEFHYENKLATVALEANRPATAVEARQTVVRLLGFDIGLDDERTILAAIRLGEAYVEDARLGDAEITLLCALERLLALYPDDPDNQRVESCRLNLANAYVLQSAWDCCFEQLETVLQSRRRVFGATDPNHPRIVSIEKMITKGLLVKEGRGPPAVDLNEVKTRYQERLQEFGPEHRDTIRAKDKYAAALHLQNRFEEAEALYRELFLHYNAKYGLENPRTIHYIRAVGQQLVDQGRPIEGERMNRKAVSLMEQTLGRQHLDTFRTQMDLNGAVFSQGRTREALRMMEDLHERATAVLGAGHDFLRLSGTSVAMAREFLPRVTPVVQRRMREKAIARSREANPDFVVPPLPPIDENDAERMELERTIGDAILEPVDLAALFRSHGLVFEG